MPGGPAVPMTDFGPNGSSADRSQLEELVFACLECDDPLAELDRRTAGGDPAMRERAARIIARVQRDEHEMDRVQERIVLPVDAVRGYRILDRIGATPSGTAYVAAPLEPPRAPRVLLELHDENSDAPRSIVAEARALEAIASRDVLPILDHGVTAAGRAFSVREQVRGPSLLRHCDDHGLGLAERFDLWIALGDRVSRAHAAGVFRMLPSGQHVIVARSHGIARLCIERLGSDFVLEHSGEAESDDLRELARQGFELLTGQAPGEGSEFEAPSSCFRDPTPRVRQQAAVRGARPGRLARSLFGELDALFEGCLGSRPPRHSSVAALVAAARNCRIGRGRSGWWPFRGRSKR